MYYTFNGNDRPSDSIQCCSSQQETLKISLMRMGITSARQLTELKQDLSHLEIPYCKAKKSHTIFLSFFSPPHFIKNREKKKPERCNRTHAVPKSLPTLWSILVRPPICLYLHQGYLIQDKGRTTTLNSSENQLYHL